MGRTDALYFGQGIQGRTLRRASSTEPQAQLLGYYTNDGRQHYAGRAGTGIAARNLDGWRRCLRP